MTLGPRFIPRWFSRTARGFSGGSVLCRERPPGPARRLACVSDAVLSSPRCPDRVPQMPARSLIFVQLSALLASCFAQDFLDSRDCLEAPCLVFTRSKTFLLLIPLWPDNKLYDSDSFKFVEVCSMVWIIRSTWVCVSWIVRKSEDDAAAERNVADRRVLTGVDRRLAAHSRPPVPIFRLIALWSCEAVPADLSVSPFSSVSFCFTSFAAVFWCERI